MKRFIVSLVVLLVLASILAGCGGAATTTAHGHGYQLPLRLLPQPPPPRQRHHTVNKFGGTLRIIETLAPGAPLGAEWEGNLGTYNTQQWVLERLLKRTERRLHDGRAGGNMGCCYHRQR